MVALVILATMSQITGQTTYDQAWEIFQQNSNYQTNGSAAEAQEYIRALTLIIASAEESQRESESVSFSKREQMALRAEAQQWLALKLDMDTNRRTFVPAENWRDG